MRKLLLVILLSAASCLQMKAQNSLRDSLAVAVEALSYHPDSLDLRLKKAGWNLQLEQWEYALSEYNYVLKMEPQNVAALYYRAYVFERMKKYKFARTDYETLLAIVPGHFEGKLGYALLNYKDKHFSQAINLLNSLCEQFPSRAEAFAARGGVEMDRKQYALAEYDYTQALKFDPSNIDFLMARAETRIHLKKKADAREDLAHMKQLGLSQHILNEYYKRIK